MDSKTPYGYCHCGCGQKTSLARCNNTRLGWIKGEPLNYIRFHPRRNPPKHPITNGTAYCIKCNTRKPVEEFSRDKSRPNGRSNKCSECDRIYQRNRRKEKPEHCKTLRKRHSLKQYGVGVEHYYTLFEEQEGKCAICRLPETQTKKGTLCDLSLDHSHLTGKVRGLLCSVCNPGLGLFKDNPALLEQAIKYLKRYE
jgi:hypothetical protein